MCQLKQTIKLIVGLLIFLKMCSTLIEAAQMAYLQNIMIHVFVFVVGLVLCIFGHSILKYDVLNF